MTASLRDTIQQLAAGFAAGVLDAIRGSSLEDILAETQGRRRGPGRPPKNSVFTAAAPEVASARRSAGRRKGRRLGRRSAGALERVVDRIVELLSKNSRGLRAEQIRASLGLSAKELPRPIAKALAARRIRKVGQKRATTYFAGGAGAAKPVARSGKTGKKRGRPPGSKRGTKGASTSKRGRRGGKRAKKASAPGEAAAPASAS